MNNVTIIKAKDGKGYFLDVEDVIPQAPLTALELLTIMRMIMKIEEELMKEIEWI